MTNNISLENFLDSATVDVPNNATSSISRMFLWLGSAVVILLLGISALALLVGHTFGTNQTDVTSRFSGSTSATADTIGHRTTIKIDYLSANYMPRKVAEEVEATLQETGANSYSLALAGGGSTLRYSSPSLNTNDLQAKLNLIQSMLAADNSYTVNVVMGDGSKTQIKETVTNIFNLPTEYTDRLASLKKLPDARNSSYQIQSTNIPSVVFYTPNITAASTNIVGAQQIIDKLSFQNTSVNTSEVLFNGSKVYITGTESGNEGRYFTASLKKFLAQNTFSLNGKPATFYVRTAGQKNFTHIS